MNFTQSLLKHIDKLVGSLRSDEQLQEILKRKFTKKEYKIFVAIEEGKSIEDIKLLVKEDEESIQKHYKIACKKLNQEKMKQELVSYE
jgi:DNA-binding NarL/FixJ family response regulator